MSIRQGVMPLYGLLCKGFKPIISLYYALQKPWFLSVSWNGLDQLYFKLFEGLLKILF